MPFVLCWEHEDKTDTTSVPDWNMFMNKRMKAHQHAESLYVLCEGNGVLYKFNLGERICQGQDQRGRPKAWEDDWHFWTKFKKQWGDGNGKAKGDGGGSGAWRSYKWSHGAQVRLPLRGQGPPQQRAFLRVNGTDKTVLRSKKSKWDDTCIAVSTMLGTY